MKRILAVSSALAAATLGLGLVLGQVLFDPTAPHAVAEPASATPPAVQAEASPPAMRALPSLLTPAAPPAAALPQQPAMVPMVTPPQPSGTGASAAAAPRSAPPRLAFNAAETDEPYIALTFDDGPNPETTPKLLKMLADRNIKATFFMLGNRAAAAPDVVKSVAAGGHEIGNHSWDHPQLTKLPLAAVDKEINDTSKVIQNITGKAPVYLRPPYGAMKPDLQRYIHDKYGMTFVYWSVDPLDWKIRDPQAIHDQIMRQVRPGAVILAHDIHATTVAAMPRVLDALIAKGYKFVTVSDLIAKDHPREKVVAAVEPAQPAAPKKKPRPPQRPATASTPAVLQPDPATPIPAPTPAAAPPQDINPFSFLDFAKPKYPQ